METIESYEHAGCTVEIHYDDSGAESPRDWCNLGVMLCSHRNYELGDKQASAETWDELIQEALDDGALDPIIPLYLLDHSGIAMRAGSPGRGNPFSDCDPGAWDSGVVGVTYATKETLEQVDTPPEFVEECLRQEVETYSAYLQGEVYGWVVERDREHIDSCWGYVGYGEIKHMKQEAEASAEREAQNHEKLSVYESTH